MSFDFDGFRRGSDTLLEECRVAQRRFARLSFSLEADIERYDDVVLNNVLLRYKKNFSKCRSYEPDVQDLGVLVLSREALEEPLFMDGRVCSRASVRRIVENLRNIIARLEEPPNDVEEGAQWAYEVQDAFNGWVPVAVHGMNYFSSFADEGGVPLVPKGFLTYRSGDGLLVLENLCR